MCNQNNISQLGLISAGRSTTDSLKDAGVPATFVEKLARALHRYGLPSHRIEDALVRVARRLRLNGQFFATPTAIFASLGERDDTRTVLMRMDPGDVNLEKLSDLDELLEDVVSGKADIVAASARIDSIAAARPTYGPVLTILAFAVASGTASRFFGGGWRELLVCTIIGLFAGSLAYLAGRFPTRFRAFEPAAALVAGLIAAAAGMVLSPLSSYVAMCAGLIVLIPGLTLTISINELATRNLAAGTVRMMGALVLFLEIGFGVAVGLKVGSMLFGPLATAEPAALPGWTLPAALFLAPLSFTVLFKARWRDAGWITAAAVLAFAGARVGAQTLGVEMGAFLGALLVGIGSNLHARLCNRPASVTLVPGIMLLVPGSVGFQSLSSLLAHDIVSGMQTAFTMSLLGVALVTGLLLANTLVPARKSL